MSLTAHRILQYIALILIFTAMAGGYWYWQSQAAVRINQGLEDSLEQGLVGYWKLDDASGTTATDSSGNGNNGTLTNGPTWSTGQVGGAVTFDGVDDSIVSISNSPQIASLTKATVSFWVNPTQIGGIFNTLQGDFGGNGPFVNGFEITKDTWHGTQTIRLAVDGSVADMQVRSTAVLPLSAWTHVTVVWDGTLTSAGTKFYYNGSLAGTTLQESGSGTYVPSDGRFKMGVGAGQLNGSLDEVRVYNRTLSDEEVSRLYQTATPMGIDTGLIGYWPFDGDDISGTTTSDRSGKGNHGTLVNSPAKVAGKSGQALDFWPNGADANSSVGMGDPASGVLDFGSSDFSVGFWMKSSGYAANGSSVNSPINKKSMGTPNAAGYAFTYTSANLPQFAIGNGATEYTLTGTTSIGDAAWHHWVGVRSGNTIYLYVDGIFGGSIAVSGSVSTASAFTVGDYAVNGFMTAKSSIDEVRVYNRALTAADVQDLYQKTQSDTVGASNKRDSLALGLSGYWKLDDASGTTATDSSTNGNNGTLTNGPTWTTGQVGGAVTFDGSNDYVSIPDSNNFSYNQDFSVSTWVKIPSTQNDVAFSDNSIVEKWAGSAGYPYVIRLLNQSYGTPADRGKVRFMRYDGSNNPGVSSTTLLNDNQWHFVTARKSGSTLALFVDGSMQATATDTTTGTTTNNIPIFLGTRGPGSNLLTGSIDETRIYNRSLSDEEVKKLYLTTAPTGVDTGLKGYWSFDGSSLSGTTVSDWSGAVNTGTSSGGPVVAAGPMGQALTFDGVNDGIDISDSASLRLPLGGKMSIDCWYKSNISSGVGTIYSKASGAGDSYGLVVVGGASSHALAFYYRSYNGSAFAGIDNIQVTGIEKNVWHHISSSYDMSTGIFNAYIDGVLVKTMTVAPNANIANTGVLAVGYSFGNGANIAGQLDELRVYNRILSVDEVREAYDYGKADKVNTAGSDPLTDGLAGYWKLDDASGTTATDSSGNGHTGTLYNSPTWSTAGRVSGAVNFDGTDDYINIPSITAAQFGNTTFTFAGWIKTTSTQKFIAAQDYCSGGWGIGIDSFYKVFVGLRSSGACGGIAANRTSATAITPNEWHHIVAVIKTDTSVGANNDITLYVDGVLNQDTLTTGGAYGATGANGLEISGRYTNDQLFSGPMDELRLYNRGLSSEEVQKLYRTTAPTGVDTGLVGYWSFDGPDVAGTTAYDRSGKGNHGSLVNGPSVIAGKIGQALSYFPGGTDTGAFAGMGDPSSGVLDFGTGDFAVGFWMKSSGYVNQGSTANMPFSKSNNDFISPGYLFKYGGGNQMIFVARNGATDYEATAAGATTGDGQWHHYIGQRSGSTIYIYVDGALAGSSTVSGSVSTTTGVGVGDDGSGYRNVNGSIDEVRIYNRALTSAEIQNLYNKGR